tara:strand:- start:1325 stop:1792 length:468 start_codon:yes stop_codon:yes gene_type:complete
MAYDKENIQPIKEEILKLVSDGLSLSKALDSEAHLPSRQTVYNWFNKDHADYDETFLDNYTRAREVRSDRIFEEILEIADDSSGDTIITGEGKEVFSGEFAARSRIKIDARKWMLGKMQPKKYGDKLDITSDGDKLQQAVITIDPLNDTTNNGTT